MPKKTKTKTSKPKPHSPKRDNYSHKKHGTHKADK